MIKRFIAIAAIAFACVSCFKKGLGYESNFTANIGFEEFSESWDNNEWNGEFYGDDDAYFESSFYTNTIEFICEYNKNIVDYSGFGLSRVFISKGAEYDKRLAANSEKGLTGDVFALFHNNPDIEADKHIAFTMPQNGTCTPVYCLVNNTKLVADMVAEYNSEHETPIEVKLTATGYNGDTKTGSAEILLAGPAEKGEAKDSIVSTWTQFDLSKLGTIEYIRFDMSFSDESQTSIPEYFCLDNFFSKIYITNAVE